MAGMDIRNAQGTGVMKADNYEVGSSGLKAFADRPVKVAKVALGVGTSGGGVGAWQNPDGVSVLIHRVLTDIITPSSVASTLDYGTTATSATTSSDNLIDGVSAATAGLIDTALAATLGTNGKNSQKLAAGKWLTISQASGAVAGLSGNAYIYYTPV